MSSDEEEDGVKLYSALERNKNRRQQFVSLSSSESEDESDSVQYATPPRKRSRQSQATPPASLKKVAEDSAAGLVVLDDEDDDDFMSETEKAQERKRKLEWEAEIQRKLALDPVLNRTRSIMNQTTTMKERIVNDVLADIIELDSDDEDDGVQILPQKTNSSSAPPASTNNSTSSTTIQDKGERVALQVRSNGTRTDEIVMFANEPFSLLYERFCDLHGLPRSAVQMAVDGDDLRPTDTPHKFDLESGDLVDAKVDFSKADARNKRQLVLLRLVVEGKRPEKFKIDVNSTMEKLHASFCKKHNIADPDDVVMTVKDLRIRMSETVGAHDLYDNDEIKVEIRNFVDPAAIELKVRYDAKTSRQHSVIPNQRVETLIAQVASHLGVTPGQVSLRVDGEGMQPHQTFEFYELEGGELLEVKLQS